MPFEPVTVAVINFNGEKILGKTISSLKKLNYPDFRIILIDDGSTDKSLEVVRNLFPEVEVFQMGKNTKHPNMVRNRGLKESNTLLVFLIDNDIIVHPDCLSVLVKTIRSSKLNSICTPRLMYYDQPERLYVDASKMHYAGTSISYERDKTIKNINMEPESTAGGGTMLIDKKKVLEVGFLDEDYGMGWGEDGEIYSRMKIAGYRCLYVPQSVALHEAKEWSSARHSRAYGQVKNRWHLLLSTYQLKTLILVIPALIVYEIFLLLFMTLKGIPHLYFKGNIDVVRSLNSILKKRKVIQATRRVPDRELLTTGDMYISPLLIQNPLMKIGIKILNGFFNGYWRIIKRYL